MSTLDVPPASPAGQTAPEPAAPTAVAPPPPRRAALLDRFASPLIVVGVAALIVAASAVGDSLGGLVPVEIVTVLAAGALFAAALLQRAERPADAAMAPGDERSRVPGGWALVAFIALAALTATSIVWAIDPPGAWLEANRTIAYAAAFAGAAALAAVARDRAGAFAGGLLLGATVVCLLALTSKMVPEWLNEAERFARLREPFGYWNAVGLIGALTAPGALWLGSRRSGSPAVNVLAYPAMTIGVLTMLLAYSRGSLLAAAIGAIVWFVLVPQRRLRGAAILLVGVAGAAFVAAWTFGQDALTEDRVPLAARGAAGRELLVCLVAVLLIVYVAGLVVSFVSDLRPLLAHQRRTFGAALIVCLALTPAVAAVALAQTDQGLGGSISTAWKTVTDPDAEPPSNDPGRLTQTGSIRARYWDDALQMAKDRPAGGWGAGGFGTARPRYRTDTIDVGHAHGFVAQTLADLGFVGLGLSLLLFAAWVLAARAAIRAAAPALRPVLVTLAATATVFGVHSLIDWTWFTAGTAFAGLLAAGWLAGAAPAGRFALRLGGASRIAAAVVVALLALAAAWSAWQPLRSENASDAALAAADARQFDDARAHARRAHDINPLSATPFQALASVERAAGDIPAAETALQRAVDTEPANSTVWLRLAEFQLWVANRPEDALESVRAALYLNPASFVVIQRYLDIYRTIQARAAGKKK